MRVDAGTCVYGVEGGNVTPQRVARGRVTMPVSTFEIHIRVAVMFSVTRLPAILQEQRLMRRLRLLRLLRNTTTRSTFAHLALSVPS